MTTVGDAIRHAELVLEADQLQNASYDANGQLAQHAVTARILLEVAERLAQFEDEGEVEIPDEQPRLALADEKPES